MMVHTYVKSHFSVINDKLLKKIIEYDKGHILYYRYLLTNLEIVNYYKKGIYFAHNKLQYKICTLANL